MKKRNLILCAVLCAAQGLATLAYAVQLPSSTGQGSVPSTPLMPLTPLTAMSPLEAQLVTASSEAAQTPQFVKNELVILLKSGVTAVQSAPALSVGAFNLPDMPTNLNAALAKFSTGSVQQLYKVATSTFMPKLPLGLPIPWSGGLPSVNGTSATSGDDAMQMVKITIDGDPLAAAKAFSALDEVVYAEPNYIYSVQAVPNDPLLHSSGTWGQDFDDLWGVKSTRSDQAWAQVQGEGVLVAVIDSGVDTNHEDIIANMWVNTGEIAGNLIDDDNNGYVDDIHGWNFAHSNNDVGDVNGHGTHVAGTIAATGDNGVGIIGVAPKANIMALKGLNDNGSGYSDRLAMAIRYAADNGAQVINNSWGGFGNSMAVSDAITYAHSQGVVVVAAAGNSNMHVGAFYPASNPEVISVCATGTNNNKASFSNWGEGTDVCAPGVETLSLNASGSSISERSPELVVADNYLRISGTSMAAPHIAGIAALMLEKTPSATPEQVRYAMHKASVDTGHAGWDAYYGHGIIDALNAVALVVDAPDLFANISGPNKVLSGDDHNIGRGHFRISGSAQGNDFSHYELAFAPLNRAQVIGAFDIISSSNNQIGDAELGHWDASALANGDYVIRLAVIDSSGFSTESYRVVTKDSTLKPGFPKLLEGLQYSETIAYADTVNFVDLDNDGQAEILAVKDGNLSAWHSAGQLLSSFPISLSSGDETAIISSISSGDLDGDGDQEIFYVSARRQAIPSTDGKTSQLHAIHHDGRRVSGFPVDILDLSQIPAAIEYARISVGDVQVAMSDLDGDGSQDLVIAYAVRGLDSLSYPGYRGTGINRVFMTVVGADGNIRAGWPQQLNDYGYVTHSPSIVDLDGDGNKEILVAATIRDNVSNTSVTDLTLYASDGAVEAQASFIGTGAGQKRTLVADIDGDGQQEVMMAVLSNSNAVLTPEDLAAGKSFVDIYETEFHLLDNQLQPVAGWPQRTPGVSQQFQMINVDADRELELVFMASGDLIKPMTAQLQALNVDGSLVAGFASPMAPYMHSISGRQDLVLNIASVSGPAITGQYAFPYPAPGVYERLDLNRDPYLEGFALLGLNGESAAGWPKKMASVALGHYSASVQDIDRNLMIGAISASGHVYVWNEQAADNTPAPWPTFMGDNARTGRGQHLAAGSSADNCEEFSAFNTTHFSAGRATKEGSIWATSYYATGSHDSLGSAYVTTTLHEVSPGYFEQGNCPAVPEDVAPSIDSATVKIKSQWIVVSGTAADDNGDLVRIEVDFSGEGDWIKANGRAQWTLSSTSVGLGNIRVRALDAAGNYSAITLVDHGQHVPECLIDRIERTNDGLYRAWGSASDLDGLPKIEFRLDGGAWSDQVAFFDGWMAPMDLFNAASGMHSFEARAIDPTGLAGSCGQMDFEVFPHVAPETLQAVAQVDVDGITLHGLATDADGDLSEVEISVDGAAWQAVQTTHASDGIDMKWSSAQALSDGMHQFSVRARDSESNLSDVTTVVFEVGNPQAPSCSIELVAPNNNGEFIFPVTLTDANNDVSQAQYRIDGGSWQNTYIALGDSSVDIWSGTVQSMTQGDHTIEVTVTDSTGLSGGCGPETFTVGVSGSVPSITGIAVSISGLEATISGSAVDADGDLDRIEIEFDNNGNWVQITGTSSWSHVVSNLAAGGHTVKARAVDQGGRISTESVAVSFTLVESALVCITDTLANNAAAGPVYITNTLYYATGSAAYLGSTYVNASDVISLQQSSPDYWEVVSSCP